jgi:phytoene synthase
MPPRSAEPAPQHADADDLAACRALLRDGSRTFHAASRLLPAAVAEPAVALYAFCRLADDAIDHSAVPHAALATMRARLAAIYAGHPADVPADRAFADVVARFSIPQEMPDALLEGFAWDAAGRRYETISALRDYAARVAGTVGAMMSILMGGRAPDVLARACDLGVAMQLTNIARDVGEDARAGRLYLPLAWLREAGVDPDAWLARPTFSPSIACVVQRLLLAADELYRRADAGIAQLPLGCRPAMRAAQVLYAEIGREVERRGLDSVNARAVVPGTRKARLLLGALGDALLAEPPSGMRGAIRRPVLEETRFLVESAARGARAAAAAAVPDGEPQGGVERGIAFVVGLFERLERRERAAAETAR